MDNFSRPKTANFGTFQFGTDLAARNTLQDKCKIKLPPIGLGARGSGQGLRRTGGAPSSFSRSVEIQRNYWTDPPNHDFGEYQDTFETFGGGYRPAEDDSEWPTYQLPGYQSLPVMEQQRALNPYGRTVHSNRAATAAGPPHYRSGRNGSNWRHVTQCTGNLGNHIVFINGRVKTDDCDRFPPHGYPGDSQVVRQSLPIVSALPARHTAGTKTGGGLYGSKSLQRARLGSKYWFEDKKPAASNWKYAFGSKGSCLGIAGSALAGGF